MEQCNEKEGYLLMYAHGGDEIHIDLISAEHYNKIINDNTNEDDIDEVAFAQDPLHYWFSQTMCYEDWPYKNVKILGTIHIWAL